MEIFNLILGSEGGYFELTMFRPSKTGLYVFYFGSVFD